MLIKRFRNRITDHDELLIPREDIPTGLSALDRDVFEMNSFLREVADYRRVSEKVFSQLKRVSEYREMEIDLEKLRDILSVVQLTMGELQNLNKGALK